LRLFFYTERGRGTPARPSAKNVFFGFHERRRPTSSQKEKGGDTSSTTSKIRLGGKWCERNLARGGEKDKKKGHRAAEKNLGETGLMLIELKRGEEGEGNGPSVPKKKRAKIPNYRKKGRKNPRGPAPRQGRGEAEGNFAVQREGKKKTSRNIFAAPAKKGKKKVLILTIMKRGGGGETFPATDMFSLYEGMTS